MLKQINVLIDMHVFDHKYQGTRTYLKGLYSELMPIAKNWHFYLVARNIENLKKEFGAHKNVTYVPLKSKNKFYRLLFELPQLIKKHKIDYAHYQYICPPIKNCKLIITTHDILFEQNEFKKFFPLKYRTFNSFLFKRSAKKADLLLTVSQYSRNRISELYNIPVDSIYITPNAVSNSGQIKQEVIDDTQAAHGKYILYVSRVEPRKNHLGLLKAFVELNLKEQGYKLVFIGKKDILHPELERYLTNKQPKIKDSVVWLHSISNNSLEAYYRNCELFVFPSFAEGFGIPPLEAMAQKSKILCSKSTAMADFNLPDALVFDPKDIEELKKKMMIQLTSEKIQLDVYGVILAKYNWLKISQDYFKLLEKHNNNIFD